MVGAIAVIDTVIDRAAPVTRSASIVSPSLDAHRGQPAGLLRITALLAMLVLLGAVGGCASTRPDAPRSVSHAIDVGTGTSLGRAFAEQAARHPGLSGFRLLVSGRQALSARATLAATAEHTIDLQYFSVGDDLTVDLLLGAIVAAADRGVRVRILLDDIAATSRRFAWRAIAAHPDIQVRLFNPFRFSGNTFGPARIVEFAFRHERLNRRMHNKLWVTDNAAAIVGSRNLSAEYFEANDLANFNDVDLLAVGPVVDDMSKAFDLYWNDAAAVPAADLIDAPTVDDGAAERRRLHRREAACAGRPPCSWLRESGTAEDLRSGNVTLAWASAQFVYDLPDRVKSEVPSGIEHGWIEDHPGGIRTREEILIVTPYLVPSPAGLRHLEQMRQRDVRVAILTNSLDSTDSVAAHAGYARHRPALVRAGVELHEIRLAAGQEHERTHLWGLATPSSLHAKFSVQDRKRVIIGSQNQDPRSRLLNTEAWIVVDSAALAAELVALFEEGSAAEHAYRVRLGAAAGTLIWETEEDGRMVRFADEPAVGSTLILWRKILGHLIPEGML